MKNSNSSPKAKTRSLRADEKSRRFESSNAHVGGAAWNEAVNGPLRRPADPASGVVARRGRYVPRHIRQQV